MDEELPIILPSNGGGITFANNRPGDYTILLNQPLDLEDSNSEYRVSMQEIQFIRALPTLSNHDFRVHVPQQNSGDPPQHVTRTVSLRTLQLTDTASFIKEINARLRSGRLSGHVMFLMNPVTFHTTIRLANDYIVEIPDEWSKILGFRIKSFINNEEISDHPADLYQGVYNLYVYSDIVQPIPVGNTSQPLLGIISIPKGARQEPEVVTKTFTNPMKLRLANSRIETIRIYIKDDLGNSVHFRIEPVVVRLSIHRSSTKQRLLQ